MTVDTQSDRIEAQEEAPSDNAVQHDLSWTQEDDLNSNTAAPETAGSAGLMKDRTLAPSSAMMGDEDDDPMDTFLEDHIDLERQQRKQRLRCYARIAVAIVLLVGIMAIALGTGIKADGPNTSSENDSDKSLNLESDSSDQTSITPSATQVHPNFSDFVNAFKERTELDFDHLAANPSFDTPQFQAMDWLSWKDPYIYQILGTLPGDKELRLVLQDATDRQIGYLLQRYILLLLYFGTGGDAEWKKDQDGNTATQFQSNLSVCDWNTGQADTLAPGYAGVQCTDDDLVVDIELTAQGLKGQLPTELGALTSLKRILIDHNQISGPIPSEIGRLKSLTHLYIDYNELTGQIPTELKELQNLFTARFDNNDLNGDLDAIFCSAKPPSLNSLEADCGDVPPKVVCSCCLVCTGSP